jgi:uncharacterized protein (TIRG00374 family)
VVFYFADLGKMGRALLSADLRYVAAAFLLSIVWLTVRAQVWYTLLQARARFGQVFVTISEGYLLNNLLPFRLGEVGRAFLLSHKAKLDFWQVMSTILVERILDLALATGLLLATLPFVVGASWAQQAAWVAGILVVVGLGGLVLLARQRRWAEGVFNQLARRVPLLGRIGAGRVGAFFEGLEILAHGRTFLVALGWISLNWGLAILEYYVLMLAFFPQGKFLWAAFSLGVVSLGVAAPSSPGAVGVMELALVGALAVFQLDPSTSLAFALSAHLLNYLLTGVIGAFALAREGESLASLYRRIRHLPQQTAASEL